MVAPTVPKAARFRQPVRGVIFRGFAGIDADIPGMAEVARRQRQASGEIEPVDEAEMRASYAHLEHSDPAHDMLVAELEGTIVGYSRVEWGDTNDGERYYDGFCFMDPGVRRRGIGRAMLTWNEARRRAIAADHVIAGHGLDRPRWLTTFAFDGDPGAAVLLRSAGYAPFRRFYSMVRPDLESIPDAPLPAGIEVRPVAPDRAAMRQVFDADAEAFRDHFGWVSGSDDAFAAFVEDPGTDPSLWLVGFDGDDVAGAVLNGIHGGVDGRPADGWLDSVFTRRPWRRRGLARALIVRSLALLREHGLTSASLGVDAQNPNQALHLYESCGFRVASSSTAYRKPVADEPPEDRRGIR